MITSRSLTYSSFSELKANSVRNAKNSLSSASIETGGSLVSGTSSFIVSGSTTARLVSGASCISGVSSAIVSGTGSILFSGIRMISPLDKSSFAGEDGLGT